MIGTVNAGQDVTVKGPKGTLNLTVADPVDPSDAGDLDAARRIDGQFNRWFLDPIFRGSYPTDVVEDIRGVCPEAIEALDAAALPGDLDTIATRINERPRKVLGWASSHDAFTDSLNTINGALTG